MQSAGGRQTIRKERGLQERPAVSQTAAFGEEKLTERADWSGHKWIGETTV